MDLAGPLIISLLFTSCCCYLCSASSYLPPSCKGWLVQSIPTDTPDLRRVPGVLSTGEVLRWLAGNASERLDVIAQYWQLLHGSGNPNSGDYGYSDEDMRSFGAPEGRSIYEALEAAADRNVQIRIVQHSGFFPEFDQESSNLASGRPNVHNVTLLFADWWGSGVVHAKVWISDGKDIYIGSANNDWKSLTQLLFGKFQADGQGWVETIMSVRPGGTVRMSTMTWLGQSEYLKQTVYWSSLSSALSEVVFSKNATVKILVAYWDHSIENTDHYLKSLLYSNNLCKSSKYNSCNGNIEIRYYMVPGFESTGPAIKDGKRTGNAYPDFTRVNHGKYAVSDTRAHIGTSNLVWDYFYTTAGVSFGTYNPSIVAQLQGIFDADWNSPYTVAVKPLQYHQQI